MENVLQHLTLVTVHDALIHMNVLRNVFEFFHLFQAMFGEKNICAHSTSKKLHVPVMMDKEVIVAIIILSYYHSFSK